MSDVDGLNQRYDGWESPEILRDVLTRRFKGRIAVSSSFGVESAVLLDMVAAIDPTTPVLFLDTGVLFAQTLDYQRRLSAHLGLTDVRVLRPDPASLPRESASAPDLWETDNERCCHLRKVAPLARALNGFDAWITGRKRAHGGARSELDLVEQVDGHIKINPMLHWTSETISKQMQDRGLPAHPMEAMGYASVGCFPCTRATLPGEGPRGGRWAGRSKTECGIHRLPPSL